MIISHQHKYLYLEPVGMDSHLGHQFLRDFNLIAPNDIASAVYIGEHLLYGPQNFQPLTYPEYETQFGFKNYARKPIDSIMNTVNVALTPTELVELELLSPEQLSSYQIICPVRNPLDRFCSIFTASQWGRPITRLDLSMFFSETLFNDQYTHLLWQDQYAYHFFHGEPIALQAIRYEDYRADLMMALVKFGIVGRKKKIPHRQLYSMELAVDEYVHMLIEEHHEALKKRYELDMVCWEKYKESA